MSFGSTIGAVIIGGFITWYCSRCYYLKASKETKKVMEQLKQFGALFEFLLDELGIEDIKIHRDKRGVWIVGKRVQYIADTLRTILKSDQSEEDGK